MSNSTNKRESKKSSYDPENLINYTRSLEREVQALRNEKRLLDAERMRIEREVQTLRVELERLRTPPLLTGYIVDVLEDGKCIVKSSSGPNFVVYTSSIIKDEDAIVPGARVALNQRSFAIVDVLPATRDPFVRGMEVEEAPNVTYNGIGGLDEQLREIRETVELPLLHPELFERVGIEPPKGVLLYGLPGTGKTLIARAVANETHSTFVRVIGSELVQKYIGEGARIVREIFNAAREKSPTILFIDELDAIGGKRLEIATSGDREVQRTLLQLLSEMDGFDPRGDVKIVGATNRPDILDVALLRPGRFDRLIEIPMPNEAARRQIFEIHIRNMNIGENIDFDRLTHLTEGSSGADIKNICTEAGMFAIREMRKKIEEKDFDEAVEKVLGKTAKTRKKMRH